MNFVNTYNSLILLTIHKLFRMLRSIYLVFFIYVYLITDNTEKFVEITDYIKKLGSQNWEHIQKEPERLTEEMKQLTEQTQELAFTNYKTFVETAEISRTVIKDLDKSKESLKTFLETTPEFLQECEKFSQVASNIVKEKRYRPIYILLLCN